MDAIAPFKLLALFKHAELFGNLVPRFFEGLDQ